MQEQHFLISLIHCCQPMLYLLCWLPVYSSLNIYEGGIINPIN